MARLECKTGYYWNLWVWKNIPLYDINYLISRIRYRIRKYSYPTPGFCGLRKASIGNLSSRSILGFSIRLLRIRQFCSPHLYIFRHLEGGTEDNFSYVALVISPTQRNSNKTRIGTGNLYYGSRSDMGYNTMSLTYIFLVVFDGWFWILWPLGEPKVRRGPSHSAKNNYLIFFINVSSLLSFYNLLPLFFSLSFEFAYMEPISHCAYLGARSGYSISKRPNPFFW